MHCVLKNPFLCVHLALRMSEECSAGTDLTVEQEPDVYDLWEVHKKSFEKERGKEQVHSCVQNLYEYLARDVFGCGTIKTLKGYYCKIYRNAKHTQLPQIHQSIHEHSPANSLALTCFTGLFIQKKEYPDQIFVIVRYHKFKTGTGVLVIEIPGRSFCFPDRRFTEIGKVDKKDKSITFLSLGRLRDDYQLYSGSGRSIILGTPPEGGIRKSVRKKTPKTSRQREYVPDETEVISDDEDQYSDAADNDPRERSSRQRHGCKQGLSSRGDAFTCPQKSGSGSGCTPVNSIFGCVGSSVRDQFSAKTASGGDSQEPPPLVHATPIGDDSEFVLIPRSAMVGLMNQLSAQAVVTSFSDFWGLVDAVDKKKKELRNTSTEVENLTSRRNAWDQMMFEIGRSRVTLCDETERNQGKRAKIKHSNATFLSLSARLPPDLYAFGELFQQFLKNDFVGEIVGTQQVEGPVSSGRQPRRIKKYAMNVEDIFPEDIQGMREPKFFIDMRVQFSKDYFGMFLGLKLRQSATLEWSQYFRESVDEDLAFVVFGSLDALDKIPTDVRVTICFEDPDKENRFFFRSVEQIGGECDIETLRFLCQSSLLNMCQKYDHEARRLLRADGRSLHEIIEQKLYQESVQRVEKHNKRVEESFELEKRKTKSAKPSKPTHAEMLNGVKPLERMPSPARSRVILVPLAFLPLCNADLGFKHNEPCLCGVGGNPITTQVFTRYMANAGTREGSVDRSLLTGMTLPRTLTGMAQCMPLCWFYAMKPVLTDRCKR